MTSLILTVIGPDRPGLVDALSQTIKRHEANWLESRMAQLAGQFAGIIHVRVGDQHADGLTADLVNLQSRGLAVQVSVGAAPDAPSESVEVYRLELLGHDRPGIVRDLASALAARNVNVLQLETETVSAAMSGELMFKAVARLEVTGESATADELHDTLDQLAADLNLDLSLSSNPET